MGEGKRDFQRSEEGQGRKRGKIQYGKRRRRCTMEDRELGDSNKKVKDSRKARASQEPRGMTFAEISHKREREPVENIYRG